MRIQISAKGFELSECLKLKCRTESFFRVRPWAAGNCHVRWFLSMENGKPFVHLMWSIGTQHGHTRAHGENMYDCIQIAARKADRILAKENDIFKKACKGIELQVEPALQLA